jgi:hypothetical protein
MAFSELLEYAPLYLRGGHAWHTYSRIMNDKAVGLDFVPV